MSEPLRAMRQDGGPPAPPVPPGPAGGAPPRDSKGIVLDPALLRLRDRARERAEAEAAVAAVMQREADKATRLAEREARGRRPEVSKRAIALGALLLLNLYLWAGNPGWLTYREPPAPSLDFYQDSYRMAVYLQRQRIEEYRRDRRKLPVVAKQAGPPVHGVEYTPLGQERYRLQVGRGTRAVVYTSTDSIATFMGRTLIQMGMRAKGIQ